MVAMRRLALVALVALACGSSAQGQDLRLAYHTGDTYKYAIHSTANETIDAGIVTVPIQLDMSANQTVTVKSVDSSGTADISVDMSNVSIKTTMNQSTTTSPAASQTLTMQVGADGRIISLNGGAVGANPFTVLSGVGGGFITAVLPDKSVQPGDTWTKNYDQANPQGSGSIHVTATSKYLRDEAQAGANAAGAKAAVVETTSNSAIDMTLELAGGQTGSTIPGLTLGTLQSISFKGTIKAVITSWIDPSTHRVAKTHRTSNVVATMTMNFPPSSSPSIAGLTGPINIKGDETTDLTPA
jgi:hypothetical protein